MTAGGVSVQRGQTVGEFWTSAQRKASPIHEISYRACFKPQVPRFFIQKHTLPGDIVYDPFMGRGTTVLEAVLAGRRAVGNDINPLSLVLLEPRLSVPEPEQVKERLTRIRIYSRSRADRDLSMFFHPATESELISLKRYLQRRKQNGEEDGIDKWIRMIATNRLTGHSPGFFSVYTLPPNQAVLPEQQRRINRALRQRPPYRNVKELILRKSDRLLRRLSADERQALGNASVSVQLLNEDARKTRRIRTGSIALTVTSPPFLDIVNYPADNWMRCWFNGIDAGEVSGRMTLTGSLKEWEEAMSGVFAELFRITRSNGVVAFEVGEIRKGTLKMEEIVAPLGVAAGFTVDEVLINEQLFTKTSNIWGVRNNAGGTNTNRIVLFRKR